MQNAPELKNISQIELVHRSKPEFFDETKVNFF